MMKWIAGVTMESETMPTATTSDTEMTSGYTETSIEAMGTTTDTAMDIATATVMDTVMGTTASTPTMTTTTVVI